MCRRQRAGRLCYHTHRLAGSSSGVWHIEVIKARFWRRLSLVGPLQRRTGHSAAPVSVICLLPRPNRWFAGRRSGVRPMWSRARVIEGLHKCLQHLSGQHARTPRCPLPAACGSERGQTERRVNPGLLEPLPFAGEALGEDSGEQSNTKALGKAVNCVSQPFCHAFAPLQRTATSFAARHFCAIHGTHVSRPARSTHHG